MPEPIGGITAIHIDTEPGWSKARRQSLRLHPARARERRSRLAAGRLVDIRRRPAPTDVLRAVGSARTVSARAGAVHCIIETARTAQRLFPEIGLLAAIGVAKRSAPRPGAVLAITQLHAPFEPEAEGLETRGCALESGLEHTRFDALIEPSRHRNCSPTQRSTPPFFPEQG